ncbi:MAG: hypothetical protein GY935_20285 [Gammaproteobacteria bacterium]|nr:hypothetical protein [Gammaproteobacteria bacterium]
MSGSMHILPVGVPAQLHEHVELQLGNGQSLKFRDPRRFGALLYCAGDPLRHRLLKALGPEPLCDGFDSNYLYQCCRHRSAAIKNVLVNSHIVVGVGNIYASEALFRAGIRPTRAARRLSKPRLARLVDAVRDTLTTAIEHGGRPCRTLPRPMANPVISDMSCRFTAITRPVIPAAKPLNRSYRGSRPTTARNVSPETKFYGNRAPQKTSRLWITRSCTHCKIRVQPLT